MDYQTILNKISKEYKSILKENLVGIYVHGSIALGCFNWNKSDIDFLVVVNEKLSNDIKRNLMDITIELNDQAPPKGLEMSIVLKEYCKNFKYPTPFELHFSNMHINWYNNNPDYYCNNMQGEDKDLAAHFMIIKGVGVTIYGEPMNKIFGDINKEYYLDSIKCDIKDAKSEIFYNPMYIVLNLCRVVAYIQNDLVLSKEQGGKWAIENLNSNYISIINRALESYRTDKIMNIKENEAKYFCDYMLSQVF